MNAEYLLPSSELFAEVLSLALSAFLDVKSVYFPYRIKPFVTIKLFCLTITSKCWHTLIHQTNFIRAGAVQELSHPQLRNSAAMSTPDLLIFVNWNKIDSLKTIKRRLTAGSTPPQLCGFQPWGTSYLASLECKVILLLSACHSHNLKFIVII